MNNKNKKVSDFISEVYKDLPVEMRTGLIVTARELLEIQRKDKVLVEGMGEGDLGEDGENL